MIVAATNIVSELMKAERSAAVRTWVFAHHRHELRITAVTVAEILCGIERLPKGEGKAALCEAAVEIFSRFAEDVLAFDAAAATVYPEIVEHRERQEAPISGYEIAAICRVHDASLATRSDKDFADVGVDLIPWASG